MVMPHSKSGELIKLCVFTLEAMEVCYYVTDKKGNYVQIYSDLVRKIQDTV